MRTRKFTLKIGAAALTLAALPLAATQAVAAEYWLRAAATTVTMPDSTVIPVWGYANCSASWASCGAVSVPGPALNVTAGDGTLLIHLQNNLSVPTSLVVNGLSKPMTPVWLEPDCVKTYPACDPNPLGGTVSSGARPSPTARVRSFDAEVPALGTGDYAWSDVAPGTYLYQSGTHVQAQVQMGLYGALTKNAVEAAAGTPPTRAQAYAGSAYGYDNQVTLVYSEIDPAMHTAIAGGTFQSAINYAPRYFLINGLPYPGNAVITPAGNSGTTLLRLLNAGLTTHVPMIKGAYWTPVAEDGKAYPYRTQQYTALLPASKTMDILFTPDVGGGRYAVMDRRLGLSNNGAPDWGGMLAFLQYGAAGVLGDTTGGNIPPVANDDPGYTSVPGVTLNVGASGVLANDDNTDNSPYPIKAVAQLNATTTGGGHVTLYTNGSFVYTPASPGYTGADTFTYQATDGQALSNAATVTVTVAAPSEPAVATLDDFTRADGDLGASWVWPVTTSALANIQVVGNQAQAVGTDAGGLALWSAGIVSPSHTQYASVVLGADPDLSGVVLKATGGTLPQSPANYIRVSYEATSGGVVIATKMGGGGADGIFATQANIPLSLSGGERLTAVADGKGLVTVFVGGAYVGGVQLPNVPAWKGDGRIGIQLRKLGATVDDFGGGAL